MQVPSLEHLPPQPSAPVKRRWSPGLFTYLIIAAILGSLLRLFPAINIFSAADNVGIFGESEAPSVFGSGTIGAVGSPYQSTYTGSYMDNVGHAALGSSSYSSSSSSSSSYSSEPLPEEYSTDLIKAASNGNQQEVAELLSDNVAVNGRDSEKRTALIAAAYLGHNEICAMLIDNAASLNAKDKDGYSALDFAAARGLVDTVKLLLQKSRKEDVEHHIEYAMMMQAAFASEPRYLPKGKGIIAAINRISPEDKSPLHVAAKGGSVNLVDELIKRGARANLANKKGQTSMHIAAMDNKTFVISTLLKKSAKINAADNAGNTPLMLATEGNHFEAVKLLMEKGANRKLRNKKGEDAVTIAGNKGFSDIITLLQKQ